MSEKIIKAGIAGSGFAARFHFDAIQKVHSTKVEVIGAYSKTQSKLGEFSIPRNIKSFNNIDELIKQSDVIHICTPPATHEPIAIAALNQHKDVIIEKPFIGYFGDGSSQFNGDSFSREKGLKLAIKSIKRILKAERESKGSIMYAENWIYAPSIQKEKEIIEKPSLRLSGFKLKNLIPVLIL